MPHSAFRTANPTFSEQGIVFPLRVLSPREAAVYRGWCDELEEALGGKPRTIEVRQMHLHFPWAYELATHPSILDEIEQLLGPSFVIWATELFSKQPQDGNMTIGWHRDRTYMGFAPDEVVTAWIALSDSLAENGCMQALPGPERFEETDLLAPLAASDRIPEQFIDPSRVINVELQAGEMSVHDSLILHGSRANLSDRKRVGFAIRFASGNARPLHGRPPVMPARGAITSTQFECLTPPATGSAGDLADLKKSAIQHFDAIMINLQKSSG